MLKKSPLRWKVKWSRRFPDGAPKAEGPRCLFRAPKRPRCSKAVGPGRRAASGDEVSMVGLRVLQVEGRGDALRARGQGRGRGRQCVSDRTPIDGWVTWDGGHSNLMLQPGNDPSVSYASVDDDPSLVRGRPRRWEARRGDEFLKGWWLWLLRWATAPVFGRPVQRVGGQLRCSCAP